MSLFYPSTRLLVSASDGQSVNRFVLASNEWFNLQNNLQAVLALPYDYGDYQGRYGDSSSGTQMKECFDAMSKLQSVALKYGNPKLMRGKILKNPDFLNSTDCPKNDLYSATLWTLERAHQNAFTFGSYLREIPATIRGEKSSDAVAGIKTLFMGPSQFVNKMQQTVDNMDLIIKEYRALESELEEAQEEMAIFTKRSSATRESLDSEIGSLQTKIAQLEKAREDAYDKWLALTISACVVPAVIGIVGIGVMVLLSVPTGGNSFAVGSAITTAIAGAAGAGLGIAAGNARTSYDDLVNEVSTRKEFLQKRIAYRHDLGALDDVMKFSLPSSNGIVSQLGVLKGSWQGSLDEIRFWVNELSTDNLADSPWLKDRQMTEAANQWTTVNDALRAFTMGSFVDAQLIDFGASLPENDQNWQKQLVA